MKTERNTILRKVYEAMLIYEYKPSINDKEECKVLERFLVRSCNYVEQCICVPFIFVFQYNFVHYLIVISHQIRLS